MSTDSLLAPNSAEPEGHETVPGNSLRKHPEFTDKTWVVWSALFGSSKEKMLTVSVKISILLRNVLSVRREHTNMFI